MIGKLEVTSQITFLYFEKFDEGKKFFEKILGLKIAYDPGWACVYKTSETSFIGAVKTDKGSIQVKARGGVLISLTVKNIEEVYEMLKKFNLKNFSSIKEIPEIGLKSFFFKGPEDYDFEIQEFLTDGLNEIF